MFGNFLIIIGIKFLKSFNSWLEELVRLGFYRICYSRINNIVLNILVLEGNFFFKLFIIVGEK